MLTVLGISTPSPGQPMLETTIAGSLPKPLWLAETEKLWPAWKLEGAELAAGKIDATVLAVKLQEDAGVDIVSDGEQARVHFVHGFLANLDGIDFARKQMIGIRADRYKAEVPTVTGPIRRKGSVHRAEATAARTHTKRKLKFTLPGPMTIVDTIADEHYRDRAALAHAFAAALNEEAHELAALGVDVVQFDEPAFNVYMRDVQEWGVAALERAAEGLKCATAVHICYGYGIKANTDWKATLGEHWRQYEETFPALAASRIRSGLARMPQFAGADRADRPAQGQGRAGRLHRRRLERRRDAGGRRRCHPGRAAVCPGRPALSLHQLRHGPDGRADRLRQARGADGGGGAGPEGDVRPEAPLQRKSPVDQMDMPGRERALGGGEIDRERGALFRLAEPAHRLAVDELLADLLDWLAAR